MGYFHFSSIQWKSNPNHIIRNNVVYNVGDAGLSQEELVLHSTLSTGGQYNNLVYGADKDGNGISTWGVEISSGDGYQICGGIIHSHSHQQ